MTYAIILAAEHGKYTLVSNLLSFGAIATVTNFQGNTPLIAAMGAMTPPGSNVMTQLQSAGVDLNARNLQGETALMLACSYQPFNVVENLLSIGAEPNIADINGDRAINYASNTNKISALVKCNASLSFTNVKGETPLGLAMRAKPELVPYLREALSNSTVENDPNINQIKVGMTFAQVAEKIPLSEAQKSGSREHGGAWYTIPIDNNRILQLRFEHPKNNQSIRDTRLNLPPQIKPASGSH